MNEGKATFSGTVVGCDPGGNCNHGLAKLSVESGVVIWAESETLECVEEVIQRISELNDIAGLGVDTLTCWGTGPSGWRPADRWLRDKYDEVQNSIVSPNGLYGAMGLNGMAVIVTATKERRDILITETHPEILFWYFTHKKYDYENKKCDMDDLLSSKLGVRVNPMNSDEWDALISAYAALQGLSKQWDHDLHSIAPREGEIIAPCGDTHFFWPE